MSTTTAMVVKVSTGRVPARVQVTTWPTGGVEHVQPVPVPDTKVSPAGRGSVTTTPVASEGPTLATVKV